MSAVEAVAGAQTPPEGRSLDDTGRGTDERDFPSISDLRGALDGDATPGGDGDGDDESGEDSFPAIRESEASSTGDDSAFSLTMEDLEQMGMGRPSGDGYDDSEDDADEMGEDEDEDEDGAQANASYKRLRQRATRVRRSFVVADEPGDSGAALLRGRSFSPGPLSTVYLSDEWRWDMKQRLLRTVGWRAERLRALLALIVSEASYVEQLEALITYHVEFAELQHNDGITGGLNALRQVHVVHLALLALLRTLLEPAGADVVLGPALETQAPLFVTYGPLLVRLESLGALLQVLDQAQDVHAAEASSPWARFMSLSELLALPTRRLNVYKALLQQVQRATPQEHPDSEGLEAVQRALDDAKAQVEQQLQRHVEQQQMLQKQAVLGSSVALLHPGRSFVYEGLLVLLDGRQRRAQRRLKRYSFLLFSDLLVVAEPARGVGLLTAVHQIDTAAAVVDTLQPGKTATYDGLELEGEALSPDTAFSLKSPKLSFVAFAADVAVRDRWLSLLGGGGGGGGGGGKRRTGGGASHATAAPLWDPDSSTDHCRYCSRNFSMLRRRHHCRRCGNLVCGPCSKRSAIVPEISATRRVRVCDPCLLKLETLQFKHDAGRSKVATLFKDGTTQCGWLLMKTSGTRGKWVRRWCTLLGEARVMMLYVSDDADQPVERVQLRGATLQTSKAKKHSLELLHPDQQPVLLAMQSADEKEEWAEAFRVAADEPSAAAAAAEFTPTIAAALLGLDLSDARDAVVARFVSSERQYLRDLGSITDVYGSQVSVATEDDDLDGEDESSRTSRRMASGVPQFDPAAVALLHSARTLYVLTSELSSRVEAEPRNMGRVLHDVAHLFRLYAIFLAHYENAVAWLRSPKGLLFVRRCGDNSIDHLLSLLATVRERVPLYMAQLGLLLRASPEDHPEVPVIEAAARLVHVASDFVGAVRERTVARERLCAVRAAFAGSVEFGRRGQALLREGPLNTGRFRRRTVFLFTDCLVVARVAKVRSSTYKLVKTLPLEPPVTTGAGSLQFRVHDAVFSAQDQADHDEWVDGLHLAAAEAAEARASGRQRGAVQVHGFNGSCTFEPCWAVCDAGELLLHTEPEGPLLGSVLLLPVGVVQPLTLLKIRIDDVIVQLDNAVDAQDWLRALRAAEAAGQAALDSLAPDSDSAAASASASASASSDDDVVSRVSLEDGGEEEERVDEEEEAEAEAEGAGGAEEEQEEVEAPTTLAALAELMQSPERGVHVRDRRYHLRTFPQCFVGREAVDWLQRHGGAFGVVSREDALNLGLQLQHRGVFAHVRGEHTLADGYLFFEFAAAAGATAE